MHDDSAVREHGTTLDEIGGDSEADDFLIVAILYAVYIYHSLSFLTFTDRSVHGRRGTIASQ
jgi:hypothetical protein